MGINSSFITNYCTQLKFQLTQQNLLSLGFEKIQPNQYNLLQLSEQKQLYQHYHSKKLYTLQNFTCPYDQGTVLARALENLEMINNNYLCNVLFSSIQTPSFNPISRTSQIKVFTQNSPLNLVQMIQQKHKEKLLICSLIDSELVIPFTNIEIANFVRSIVGIAIQIESFCLPISKIDPQNFLIMQNQAGKIKHNIDFEEILTKRNTFTQKQYLSPKIWENVDEIASSLLISKTLWKQKYEKNLVFALGMLLLHYLLIEPVYDCYDYKSKEFCKSEFENKISSLSLTLEKRLERKQKQKIKEKDFSQAEMSQFCMERTQTESKSDQEPFELVLYEMILKMLIEDQRQRIGIDDLKNQCKKLMQKVREEYTILKNEKTFVSNIHKAHQNAPKIGSTTNESRNESIDGMVLKKAFSNNEINTTRSELQRSKSKSMITHLRSRQVTERQKFTNQSRIQNSVFFTDHKLNLDKENVTNNKQINRSDIKGLKGSIRKLCGFKKVQISENSYIEGFFQNQKAHGLGKITRKNGETIECIFHNNEIIESIHSSPQKRVY